MNTSPYTQTFEQAVAFVLRVEGGFVNDPDDPGGATCYGISQRAYPELDIRGLTKDQAKAIYHRDYWQRCQCEPMPAGVACAVFDGAVNMGCSVSVKLLQRSLDRLLVPPIAVDGIVGNQTLAGTLTTHEPLLRSTLLAYRAEYYHKLVLADRARKRFIFGWLRRRAGRT